MILRWARVGHSKEMFSTCFMSALDGCASCHPSCFRNECPFPKSSSQLTSNSSLEYCAGQIITSFTSSFEGLISLIHWVKSSNSGRSSGILGSFSELLKEENSSSASRASYSTRQYLASGSPAFFKRFSVTPCPWQQTSFQGCQGC